jgi:hypothetical protein
MHKIQKSIYISIFIFSFTIISCQPGGKLYCFNNNKVEKTCKEENDFYSVDIDLSYGFGLYLWVGGDICIENNNESNAILDLTNLHIESDKINFTGQYLDMYHPDNKKLKDSTLVIPSGKKFKFYLELLTRELEPDDSLFSAISKERFELSLGTIKYPDAQFHLGPFVFKTQQ